MLVSDLISNLLNIFVIELFCTNYGHEGILVGGGKERI